MIELLLIAALMAAGAAEEKTTTVDQAAGEILVVDEDDRTKVWKISHQESIRAEQLGDARPKHACVALGFIIESNGSTSTHRVLRSSPRGVLDAAALETIKKWRFEPGPQNPKRIPMYTTALFTAGFAAKHELPTKIGCLVEIVVPGKKKRRPGDVR